MDPNQSPHQGDGLFSIYWPRSLLDWTSRRRKDFSGTAVCWVLGTFPNLHLVSWSAYMTSILMPGPRLKDETCFLRFPELQLRRIAKRPFKRECAGASQLFPVFPTPNQSINRVGMRCCSEFFSTVIGAGSCTRK